MNSACDIRLLLASLLAVVGGSVVSCVKLTGLHTGCVVTADCDPGHQCVAQKCQAPVVVDGGPDINAAGELPDGTNDSNADLPIDEARSKSDTHVDLPIDEPSRDSSDGGGFDLEGDATDAAQDSGSNGDAQADAPDEDAASRQGDGGEDRSLDAPVEVLGTDPTASLAGVGILLQ